METHKTCSVFGHRKIEASNALKQSVKECIEGLIVKHNVLSFLFGSKSNFDDLCHSVVSELRKKIPKHKENMLYLQERGLHVRERERKM